MRHRTGRVAALSCPPAQHISTKFGSTMHTHTRKMHALLACALFLLAAGVYGKLTGQPLELWRVAFWSMIGVASYIALSGLFGFDPHRTRVARYASPPL